MHPSHSRALVFTLPFALGRSYYCSGNYGYAHLTANATTLHWTWNTTVPVKGGPNPTFSDDLYLVKH